MKYKIKEAANLLKSEKYSIYSDIKDKELLREILSTAFPKDPDTIDYTFNSECSYYGYCNLKYGRWSDVGEYLKRLKIINLSDILNPNSVEVVDEEVVKENYDFINPNHYKKFSYEVIDMMCKIWGKEATAIHCEMCAFKYRLRMGEKPDQPIERDLEKVNWYLNKAKELRS